MTRQDLRQAIHDLAQSLRLTHFEGDGCLDDEELEGSAGDRQIPD